MKTNKQKTIVTITALERLNNSTMGNPAYRVCFETIDDCLIGRTAPNSSSAYALGNYSIGRKYTMTYHFTQSGKLYIDYVKEYKENK